MQQIKATLKRSKTQNLSEEWLDQLCGSSHLANHQSTDSEIEDLLSLFQGCIDTMHQRCVPEIIIAQSIDYRHGGSDLQKQAERIQARVQEAAQRSS
jgi:hypothetical protein